MPKFVVIEKCDQDMYATLCDSSEEAEKCALALAKTNVSLSDEELETIFKQHDGVEDGSYEVRILSLRSYEQTMAAIKADENQQ